MDNNKLKFAGTFLSDNIEHNRRLYYTWNEYPANKVLNNEGYLLGMYMRIRIADKVYFVSDNSTIDLFLNQTTLLNSKFFKEEDQDATNTTEETLNHYFDLIS